MKKIVSIWIAFLLVMNFISADTGNYRKIALELKKYGMILGDEKGNFNEYDKITREQSIVILSRMLGEEKNAKATNYNTTFADVRKDSSYTPYIGYAKLKGWTSGISKTEFGMGRNVSTKMMASFMLRALGHTADWKTEDIMKKARENGILKNISASENDSMIRGEVFVMMMNTLNLNINGTDEKLSESLGLTGKYDSGKESSHNTDKKDNHGNNIVVNNGDFRVISTSVVNLKEIEVEFSQEIDITTLRDAFRLQGSGVGSLEAEIGQIRNLVVLKTELPMKNLTEYKLNIRGVKSVSKMEISNEVLTFKVEDKTYPEIQEIKITGPKNLEIHFSEPINFKNSENKKLILKLGSRKIYTSLSFDKSNERVVSVKLSNDMIHDKEYTLNTFGFIDFTGYPSKDVEDKFTYQRDREAPTAEVVESTQEYVLVAFNKPVKGLRLDHFYHTNKIFHPYEAYASIEDLKISKNPLKLSDDKSLSMIALKFVDLKRLSKNPSYSPGNYPLKSGKVDFYISSSSRTSPFQRIRDEWGNYFADSEFSLYIPEDNTFPIIENVDVKAEKEMVIEFNKPIILDPNNYKFYNENNLINPKLYKVLYDGSKRVKIIFNNMEFVGKDLKLIVDDVFDATVSRLKLQDKYEKNVIFSDKSFAGVKEVVLRSSDSKTSKYYEEPTVLVYFEESVDSETATNSNNYRFTSNGKNLFKLDAFYYMPNEMILEIKMDRAKYLDLFKGKNVKIILSDNVKDKSGNGFDGFSMTYDIQKSSKAKAPKLVSNFPISIKSDGMTMEINFDEALFQNDFYTVNTDMFVVKDKGKKLEIGDVRLEDKKIILTLNDYEDENKFSSDISSLSVEFRNLSFENGGIGNLQGNIVENFIAKSDKIKDEIPPKLLKFMYSESEDIKHAIYNKANKCIDLQYNEMLNENVLSSLTYEVNYYNSYYDSEKLPIKKVILDSSKKTVKVYIDYLGMSESEKSQFDENVNAASSGGVSNMFYGSDKQEYYSIFSTRISDGNYVHDMKGNAAENEDIVVYVKKQ